MGRDIPRAARKSRAAHWQLTGPSFGALIAAKDASILDHSSRPDIGLQTTRGRRQSLSAIRAQTEGRPGRRFLGRDFPAIARESRIAQWRLAGSFPVP